MKIAIILSALFLMSCGVTQKRYQKICSTCPVVTKQIDTIIQKDSVVLKDTTIVTEQDSALLSLYLECVNGKVEVRGFESVQGKKTKQNYTIKDNVLKVDCKVDSSKIAFAWLEKHKEHWKTTVIETQRPVPLELTKWQKFYLTIGKWGFWIAIAIFGVFVILELRRFKIL